MSYSYDWVDAFTAVPFGGNGCAVVHDAGGLSEGTCLSFTRETGLTECTFLEPSDVADIKVRYFLPLREIPFAGHPTVASVASLLDRGAIGEGKLTLETGAGVLPIEAEMRGGVPFVTMTQRAPSLGAKLDPGLVAPVGGLDPAELAAPPQLVSTGLPFCVALLKSKEALRALRLDLDALAAFQAVAQPLMEGAMEPFWVTLGGATAAGGTFSRLILPPPMPPEDAFTGSATGAMAAYLWANGLVSTPKFIAEQGHDMGRPGQAHVEVLGPPDAITGVRVGGAGKVLMRGQLLV